MERWSQRRVICPSSWHTKFTSTDSNWGSEDRTRTIHATFDSLLSKCITNLQIVSNVVGVLHRQSLTFTTYDEIQGNWRQKLVPLSHLLRFLGEILLSCFQVDYVNHWSWRQLTAFASIIIVSYRTIIDIVWTYLCTRPNSSTFIPYRQERP